jgi:hypothetical protein
MACPSVEGRLNNVLANRSRERDGAEGHGRSTSWPRSVTRYGPALDYATGRGSHHLSGGPLPDPPSRAPCPSRAWPHSGDEEARSLVFAVIADMALDRGTAPRGCPQPRPRTRLRSTDHPLSPPPLWRDLQSPDPATEEPLARLGNRGPLTPVLAAKDRPRSHDTTRVADRAETPAMTTRATPMMCGRPVDAAQHMASGSWRPAVRSAFGVVPSLKPRRRSCREWGCGIRPRDGTGERS